MPAKKLTFALFGSVYHSKECSFVQQLFAGLHHKQAQVLVDKSYFDFLKNDCGLSLFNAEPFEGTPSGADYAVSIGGDGTLLRTASRVMTQQTPILGINTGRLGFLADTPPQQIAQAIDNLYAGGYNIERHSAIEVKAMGETFKGCPYALNDIAILKRDHASMIRIDAFIDEQHLVTYQADGLIVSTPTGSTAYSLSNGGPIIVPDTAVLCLTPVAPHSLGVRPIIIGDNSVIRLKVHSRSHNFLIAVDGRSQPMKETTDITIRKAPYTVNILRKSGQHYFEVLKEKMSWGVDPRM